MGGGRGRLCVSLWIYIQSNPEVCPIKHISIVLILLYDIISIKNYHRITLFGGPANNEICLSKKKRNACHPQFELHDKFSFLIGMLTRLGNWTLPILIKNVLSSIHDVFLFTLLLLLLLLMFCCTYLFVSFIFAYDPFGSYFYYRYKTYGCMNITSGLIHSYSRLAHNCT